MLLLWNYNYVKNMDLFGRILVNCEKCYDIVKITVTVLLKCYYIEKILQYSETVSVFGKCYYIVKKRKNIVRTI